MSVQQNLTQDLVEFLRDYYRDEIATLAQRYPNEQRAVAVAYADLFQAAHDFADDYRTEPAQMQAYLDEALRLVDLPADVDLGGDPGATVRVAEVPEEHTYYPGEFSPTDRAGEYVAVRGEIAKASDEFSRIVEAAFECQRCGTMTDIPQDDAGFQEPHECAGCERQGPFEVDFDRSTFKDAQKLQVATPPEIASGAGQTLDVDVERDLTETATVGDRVIIAGILHLEQVTNGQQKTGQFEPYLEGRHIAVEETDHTQLEISPEERTQIQHLASGEAGDPLELAGQSIAPKIYGLEQIKRMAVLLMVGGVRVKHPDGSADRGDFHMLLLGDPGVAKSVILDRVEDIAPRSVGVSGKGAREAGITASAVRDDFGDSEWTLEAGAFVKANKGVVAIDELDDMDPEVRAAMLDPMSKQRIAINKAGINATLSTETAVMAAGNPKYGRFDPYESMEEQFDLESNLLSRFDLIFNPTDRPDPDRDPEVAGHILSTREAAKKRMRGEDLEAEAAEKVEPRVSQELLTKWIALAKRQRPPTMPEDVEADLKESFENLRGANGYDADAAVPVTWRNLEGIVRIAEAAAKFELSETVTERHAKIATEAVGQSMQDYGTDDEGQLDADVVETGTSTKTTQRTKLVADVLEEQFAFQEVSHAEVTEAVQDVDESVDGETVSRAIEVLCTDRGHAVQPERGETVKWIGRET